MPHPQAPFARQVLNFLIAEPDQHVQAHWGVRPAGCGTTLCTAGTAVVLDPDTTVTWIQGACGDLLASTVHVNGEAEAIEHRAAALLGLDYDDEVSGEHDFAYQLFYDSDEDEAVALLTNHVERLEAMP